ncbi:MAG: hypothetical protein HY552_03715 [Elusimicrobia bacterium]|nr:hypothetical protein [Elusimicrobiota bacterium]
MLYKRMNITLPQPIAKKLEKVSNKSAFIARAVAERMAALEKAEFKRRLIKDYKEAANDPDDIAEMKIWDEAVGDGLEEDDW